MMRWFGGIVDHTGDDPGEHTADPADASWVSDASGTASEPWPVGARMIWVGRFPLWLAGAWPDQEVRFWRGRSREVAVIGACATADPRIAAGDGPDLVTACPGSYTVVQADPDELRILTDLGSAWPIYLTFHAGATVWASSARALAGLTGARVDPSWLAAALVDPSARTDRSPFEQINLAPPGARIRLRPGRSPRIEPAVQIRRGSRPQAVAQLRQVLEGGIAARVRAASAPSSDLSGGLDSTSVCLLAARHTRPPATLTAVTVHPAGQDRGGDLDYARHAARSGGGELIRHRLLPLTTGQLPYTGLDRVPVTDEPAPSTITYNRLAAEFELLAKLGSDCHLTGDGGDTLLQTHGYLPELARTGRWLRLATHAQGWARLRGASPWSLAAHATRPRPNVRPPSWLTPLAVALAEAGPDLTTHHADAQTLREVQMVGRTARADAQLAETFGLAVHNPYTDSAVIAAALSVPAWRRGDPWHYKPLLTDALTDLLPPSIAARTTKGCFDAEHYLGLRTHLPTLLDLADGQLAELGLIDPARVRAALRHAAAGLPTAFGQLEPTLAAEVWLRVLTTAPRIAWTTTSTRPAGRRP